MSHDGPHWNEDIIFRIYAIKNRAFLNYGINKSRKVYFSLVSIKNYDHIKNTVNLKYDF